MTKQDFIANQVALAAQRGYYKVDIKLINECWDIAYSEGKKAGMEQARLEDDETFNMSGIY